MTMIDDFRPTYRFRIVEDYDYDPTTSVDWDDDDTAAYVARFESGELAPFGVEVERQVPSCDHCGRGLTWEPAASLWGIDVIANGPGRDAMLDLEEGWHTVGKVNTPEALSDSNPNGSYLAECLAECLAELLDKARAH